MSLARLAAGLLLAAFCGSVIAQETSVAAATGEDLPQLKALRQGYEFDRPQILVRQRLFGLAHGVSLLAGACLDVPEQAAASQEAYARWHGLQAASIREISESLAAHYFGARAAEATWSDLVRALGLKEDIRDALGEVKLEVACETLPTVLVGPRYGFDRLLADAATESAEGPQKVGAGDTPAAPLQAAESLTAGTTAAGTTADRDGK